MNGTECFFNAQMSIAVLSGGVVILLLIAETFLDFVLKTWILPLIQRNRSKVGIRRLAL